MKQRIKNTVAGTMIAAVAALSFTGCKENTIINSNLTPAVDNIKTFALADSDITVLTKTKFDDSLVTSGTVSPVIAGCGTINFDPFFGLTKSGLYFQVIPPTSAYTFPIAASAIDSVVLILPYSGFTWGDTTNQSQMQTFTAYRMLDTMSYSANYYSFKRFNVDRANPLGSATVNVYGLRNAVNLHDTTVSPHLRIKLSNNFKQLLVDSSSQYVDYPTFLTWFKGICVEPDTNNGTSIPYFELDGTDYYNTAGLLFYKNDSVITSYEYNTANCKQSNWVSRNYTSAPVAAYYNSPNVSDSIIMIQNQPGAAAEVRITNIAHINSIIGKSLINQAQILLTKVDVNSPAGAVSTTYTEPGRIFPVGVDEYGTTYSIADRLPLTNTGTLDFIDGKARTVTIGAFTVTQYSVNFPRELQQALIQGRSEVHLRINGTQTYPGAYRLVAGGKSYSNGTYKLQVNVIYSKIN